MEPNSTSSDDDLVPAVPLKAGPAETWIEREERIERERRVREADERLQNERRTEQAIARMRALATDNGDGFCRVCGVKFTRDDQDRPMHPANECAGPKPPACVTCGREPELRMRGGFKTWELTCGPADHAAALNQQNPAKEFTLERPRRVARDDEDET